MGPCLAPYVLFGFFHLIHQVELAVFQNLAWCLSSCKQSGMILKLPFCSGKFWLIAKCTSLLPLQWGFFASSVGDFCLIFFQNPFFFHENTASAAFLGLLQSDPLLLSPCASSRVTVTVTVWDPGQLPREDGVTVGTNKHSRIKTPLLFWKSWNFAPSEVAVSSPAIFSCGNSRTLWLQLLCCLYFTRSRTLKHDQYSTAASPWQYPPVNCSLTTPLMSQQHQSSFLSTWNCSLSTSCLY